LPAIFADWATSREISAIEVESSSAAEATVCTLALACSAAAATLVACCMVFPDVSVIVRARVFISAADAETSATICPTLASKARLRSSRLPARATAAD
jgi:hypothetical protein